MVRMSSARYSSGGKAELARSSAVVLARDRGLSHRAAPWPPVRTGSGRYGSIVLPPAARIHK
jgi:hypothetical protein